MKRVVAKAGRAIILEVPEPELRPGEVLVATAFSAISSGTEMHIIHSTANPETLGDDTYPRKPSLQYPAPPQLRSRGVRWSGPSAMEDTAARLGATAVLSAVLEDIDDGAAYGRFRSRRA